MKRIATILIAAAATFAAVCCSCPKSADEPLKVIIDTDMGNDIDDALSLACALNAADSGKIELLAVGCHKNCATAAAYVDAVTTWYGHPEVKVAMSRTPVQEFSNYKDYTIAEAGFPKTNPDSVYAEPIKLYREILAGAKDHSICFVSLGFGTTLAQLLESEPDDVSPLSGVDLVAKKAKVLSIMAGSYGYKKRSEYNVRNDIPAMQKVFESWPTEIVQNPFEIGIHVLYPGAEIETNLGFDRPNPVVEGYKLYGKMPYDRPTWDLLSLIYLTNPELFTKSEAGWVTVDEQGYTHFTADKNGRHYVLSSTLDQDQALKFREIEMTVASTSKLRTTAPALATGRTPKRLVCFDLDATLTQHKTQISDTNYNALAALGKKYKLLMVCAGNAPRVYNQMNHFPIDILGNYGMQEAHNVDGELVMVREDKFPADTAFFLEKTNYLREKYGYTEYAGDPVEFQPSGMVTFGLLGTQAKSEDKVAFDPDKAKRRAMYPEVLEIFKDYSIFIGGSTSFDFAAKQYNKYDAIMRYAAENGYEKDEIIFVGDDFTDGGGDSHVRLGGLDYIAIDDYHHFPSLTAILR